MVGFVGSGGYASQVLIPAFKSTAATLKSVASAQGVSAIHAAKKYGFVEVTTDSNAVITDPEINLVVIATRHDSHAEYICKVLRAGKHVFVEKPLAITRQDLVEIEKTYREINTSHFDTSATSRVPSELQIMVAFNRRFSPLVQKMKGLLAGVGEEKALVMTVNAGAIPLGHWTQDPAIGGGRIIGEACHFIDLLRFLTGSPIVSVQVSELGSHHRGGLSDKVNFTLSFRDGSTGVVHYLANGHKSFPKERLEVFCAGRVLQLDNFRNLYGFGWPGFTKMNLWRQDKGQNACAMAFVEGIRMGGASPIPFEELIEVTKTSFDIVDAL